MRKSKIIRQMIYWFQYQLPINFVECVTQILPDSRPVIKLRGLILKPFFKTCGRNFQVGAGVHFLNTHNIEIGNNVYIAFHSWINGAGGIVIEDEVVIGPMVVASSMKHHFKNGSVRFGGQSTGRIVLGKGSWLASHVTVSAGVRIGKGVLVGAGAVVTKDTADNVVVGGIPARVIKERKDAPGSVFDRWDIK